MTFARPPAQELVDALAAATLAASAFGLVRGRAAFSPLRPRLRFAFAALAAFFAARAASGTFAAVVPVTLAIACVLPLAALLLAEGVLRRHAPRALKVLVTLGGAAVEIALAVAHDRPPVANVFLGTFVVVSLGCVTAFLATRDRASLSRQENAGVDALAVPGALVTLLAVSDFVPAAPIGTSGIGVALVAFVLGGIPSSPRETRDVLVRLAVLTCVALLATCGFGLALGFGTPVDATRLGVALLALLLAAASVARIVGSMGDGTANGFARALAAADTGSLDRFLGDLAGEPLLAGLRVASGRDLAEYDDATLRTALLAHPVWTACAARDDDSPLATRAREELHDLLTRSETTHAVLLSPAPLRIGLLALPGGGSAPLDTTLALFAKLAATAAEDN